MGIRPTYWCWAEPLGKAASDPRFIQIIKKNVGTQSGTTYANTVCDEIVNRLDAGTLSSGEVAILMFNWGVPDAPIGNQTALWTSPADGNTVVTSDPEFDPGIVPFFQQAITSVSSWTDDFISRYKARQIIDERIPDPTAFWMDYEERITVGTRWFKQWSDVKADPRFGTEVVTYDGRTWSELGIPDPVDPNGTLVTNKDHTIAVRPYLLEAQSRAMDLAFFNKLEEEWINCYTANWQTTHDGVHIPAKLSSGGALLLPEYQYIANVGGTHQSPFLYLGNVTGSGSDFSVSYPLEIQPGKFSGRPYAPWIEMAGEPGIDSSTVDDVFFWTVRKPIEDGIEHILLYGADINPGDPALTEEDWNITYDAILRAENTALFSNPPQLLFVSADSSQLRIGIN